MTRDDEMKMIEDGRRVAAFLEDPAVKTAWVDMEKRYFREFKESKTPEQREALHARVLALQDLFASCLGTVDGAKLAGHAREHRQVVEERDAARRTPRNR